MHPNSLFSLLRIYLCRAWQADLLSAWQYRSIFLTDGGNSGCARREFWRGPRGEDWRRRGGDSDDSDWGLCFWDWHSLRLAWVTVRQLERGVIGVQTFNHSETILSSMETYYIKYRHILAAFAELFVTSHQRSHMANARLQTSWKHNSTIYRHPFDIFSLIHHIQTSLQWLEEQNPLQRNNKRYLKKRPNYRKLLWSDTQGGSGIRMLDRTLVGWLLHKAWKKKNGPQIFSDLWGQFEY